MKRSPNVFSVRFSAGGRKRTLWIWVDAEEHSQWQKGTWKVGRGEEGGEWITSQIAGGTLHAQPTRWSQEKVEIVTGEARCSWWLNLPGIKGHVSEEDDRTSD